MHAHTLGRQLLLFMFGMWGMAYSQPDSAQIPHPLSFQASYTGDAVGNFRGGIATGTAYLGMAYINVTFDTKAGGLWRDGTIFLKAANTHGALPSADLIGDFQILSNLEAGNHTYAQELWYRQVIGQVSITVGLQDMNAKFASNEYSGVYLNSSFGVHSTIANNVPAPIFPLTSTGVTVMWNVSDRWSLLACVYDGNSIEFKDNPYNFKWRYTDDDGVLAVAEAQLSVGDDNDRHGVYKIGAYNHDHLSVFNPETQITESVYTNNYGVYGTIDQSVAGKPYAAGNTVVFARGSVSTKEFNDNFLFFGAGVNYYGLLKEDGSDVLGLAFAHACLQSTDHESAFEVTYQTPITEHITLQPDIQYIVHPAGTGAPLPNAVAGILRFGIHF